MPLLGVLAVGLLMTVGLGRLGAAVSVAARADAVADLTALAGAVGGPGAAASVASANGAALERFRGPSGGAAHRVDVAVRVGPARATAAAAAG